jgi:glycerophosphoryl diester phosphodiesterase
MNDTLHLHSDKVRMVAHRGASGLEVENTCAAFVAAGNRSYWGIETDVRHTADGNFVLMHDADTVRVATDEVSISHSTLETLQSIRLRNKYTDEKDRGDLRIPTLQEYVAICKYYEKHAVLELKSDFTEEELCAICAIIGDYLEHTTFIAFGYENLVRLRKHFPTQSAQFLIGKEVPENWLELLLSQHLDLDIYRGVLTEEMVRICHENGITVNCWTVDDLDVAAQLAAWGVDQITTNILE